MNLDHFVPEGNYPSLIYVGHSGVIPMIWVSGYSDSGDRGIGFGFGPDIVNTFLEQNTLDFVVRSRTVSLLKNFARV